LVGVDGELLGDLFTRTAQAEEQEGCEQADNDHDEI
jgi:hypothetical protein